jgi:hypothetical protein
VADLAKAVADRLTVAVSPCICAHTHEACIEGAVAMTRLRMVVVGFASTIGTLHDVLKSD